MQNGLQGRLTADTVLLSLALHPYKHLIRRWNWKTACLSALSRGILILIANLSAGGAGAVGAMFAEACYRALTSGFCSAVTQKFRFAQPAWVATVIPIVLIPVVGESGEFVVHLMSGTQRLGATVIVSMIYTAISTLVEVFAMRRGILVMGPNSGSLLQDLKKGSELIFAFCAKGLNVVSAALAPVRDNALSCIRRIAGAMLAFTNGKPSGHHCKVVRMLTGTGTKPFKSLVRQFQLVIISLFNSCGLPINREQSNATIWLLQDSDDCRSDIER